MFAVQYEFLRGNQRSKIEIVFFWFCFICDFSIKSNALFSISLFVISNTGYFESVFITTNFLIVLTNFSMVCPNFVRMIRIVYI